MAAECSAKSRLAALPLWLGNNDHRKIHPEDFPFEPLLSHVQSINFLIITGGNVASSMIDPSPHDRFTGFIT